MLPKIDETPGCAAGLVHANDIETLKDSEAKQWDAIKELQKRLPVWVTLMLAGATFVTGSALTYAAMAAKVATYAVMASKVAAAGG